MKKVVSGATRATGRGTARVRGGRCGWLLVRTHQQVVSNQHDFESLNFRHIPDPRYNRTEFALLGTAPRITRMGLCLTPGEAVTRDGGRLYG